MPWRTRSVPLLALLVIAAPSALSAQNPIELENANQGTGDWALTNPALNGEIEGYASLTSVDRGGQIDLFVRTAQATTYRIDVYRLGWYGGAGGRLMQSITNLQGAQHAIPAPDPATGMIECNWPVAFHLAISSDWTSGAYMAKLTAVSGKQSYIVFIVRDDTYASKHLFLSSVNTHQAYNNWGGKSLYYFNSLTPVAWQGLRGEVSVSGSTISRTGGGVGWNAGAHSMQSLGNAYVEFVATNASTLTIVGLGDDPESQFNDLEYSFFLDGQHNARIRESGVVVPELSSWVAGDRFRIALQPSTVSYTKNGVLVRQVSRGASPPPLFAVALVGKQGSTVTASLGGLYGSQARRVSYDRPYAFVYGTGESQSDASAGQLFHYEYSMLRFLEREGYDVTYVTDVDLHSTPDLLRTHKALLIPGHPEYWSWEMRSSVEAAPWHGISVGYFAANVCYWQVRLEPSGLSGVPDRSLVGYKEDGANDPAFSSPETRHLTTVNWRAEPVSLSEDAFIGVRYEKEYNPPAGSDIYVSNADHWSFAGTGVTNGYTFEGLLGYEADGVSQYAPTGIEVIARSPFTGSTEETELSDMVVYTVPTGAVVFATGSMYWCHGLENHPVAQQVTRNVLDRFEAVVPIAQPVVWTNLKGPVTVVGTTLRKTEENWSWEAGASSVNAILSGDGYVEFAADVPLSMAGLNHEDSSPNYQDIDFAIYLDGSHNAYVHESGTNTRLLGTWIPGERFRVQIQDDKISYVKDGTVLYESELDPNYPLLADSSLRSLNATVLDAVMLGSPNAQEVVWTEIRGQAQVTGNAISKTADLNHAWDTGARSAQAIIGSLGGYMEFTATATTPLSMAGLNHDDESGTHTDIDFAILLYAGGHAHAFESGTQVYDLGPWQPGDRFRVGVQDGRVRYSKNGGPPLHMSSVAPSYPLYADTSLRTAGATVANVVMFGIQ